MPARLVLLAAALVACGGSGGEAEEGPAAVPRRYKDVLPAYRIHAVAPRAPETLTEQDQNANRLLYEQVFRSYPHHGQFQFGHQLVERQEDPVRVLDLIDLAPGETVADIGCGSGFFTTAFARLVGPAGTIYAVDIQEPALAYLQDRITLDPSLDPHGRVVLRLGTVDALPLPASSLDAALFSHADFYTFDQLLDENVRMIRSTFEAMKPGGRLVVVQWMGLDSFRSGVDGEAIGRNFRAAGFQVVSARYDEPADTWYYLFRRPVVTGS